MSPSPFEANLPNLCDHGRDLNLLKMFRLGVLGITVG